MAARRKLPLVSPFGPAAVVAAARDAAAQALGPTRGSAAVAEIAACAGAWTEDATAQVRARIPPSLPDACRPGCAFCCHLKVLVTAPEAVLLAEHLRATLGPGEIEALKARIAWVDQVTRGLTTDQRARLKTPCALLAGDRCAAYDARPLACRGVTSGDAALCQRAYERPDEPVALPVYKPQIQIAEAVRAGLASASATRGLDGRLFELNAALRIALERPDAGAAWARGEPALAEALDVEFEALVRATRAGSEGGA